MGAVVGIETALLLLLSVLVAGLLRSNAEILRALHRMGVRLDEDPAPAGGRSGRPAPDVAGHTPAGDAAHVGVAGDRTLVAFLSGGCVSCQPLWDGLRDGRPALPERARVVVVTRGPGAESPARLLRLAPGGVPVVMSDAAWDDYAVPGAPYVVWVDGGRVAGEGSVRDWDQLASLLDRAAADAGVA
ncbi:MAG TPA: hypothetical protein VFJ85_12105 [Acidimicrobiales bacterium]|nr:hypothetical protein [Acidimicrobiales bacterium]